MISPSSSPASASTSPLGSMIMLMPKKSSLPIRPQALAGYHEELILDGPGPQQGAPVLLARLGPLGRYADHLGTFQRQTAGEFGEAQVVADDHADLADGGVGQQPAVAAVEGLVLTQQREEVQLAVDRRPGCRCR